MKKIGISAIVFALFIGVWALLAALVRQELLIPSPLVTAKILLRLLPEGSFWLSVLLSLCRVALGFVCGVAAGTLFAVLAFVCPPTGHFLRPLLTIIKATPVASFIVLALVWIKSGGVPIFICFLMVMPFTWANVREGLSKVPTDLKEVCTLYRFSLKTKIRHLYVPSVKPYFFAALDTCIGLAWKAGIAAEILCRPTYAIGGEIWRAKLTLETPAVFAWTAVVILISTLLEALLRNLIKRRNAHADTSSLQGVRRKTGAS